MSSLKPQDITITTPRGKRERIYRHYSKVLAMILNYLEVPDSVHEWIQALIITAGFPDTDEWIPLLDGKVADSVSCGQIQSDKAVERFRKQRDRLEEWQGILENPTVVEIRSDFDHKTKHRTYSYQLPICALVRETVAACPVGAKDSKLQIAAKTTARNFLAAQALHPKPLRHKRIQSAVSNLKRGLTLLTDGYEAEIRSHGEPSADSLMRATVAEALEGENGKSLKAILQILHELQPETAGIFPTTTSSNFAYIGTEKSVSKSAPLVAQVAADRGDGRDEDREETAPLMFLNPDDEGREEWEDELLLNPCVSEEIEANFSEVMDFFTEMRESEAPTCIDPGKAQAALDAFLSVELHPDQVLFLDDADDTAKPDSRRVTPEKLTANLRTWIAEAEERRRSFIVRVRGAFVQVDDCDERSREFLEPLAFVTLETSPANYQAWIAVEGNHDRDDLDQLRRRILLGLAQKGMKGNGGSYGALRWPGSLNFKPERRGPAGAPAVKLITTQPGVTVSLRELGSFGLLPELPPMDFTELPAESFQGPQRWPSYEIALTTKKRVVIDGIVHWIPRTRSDADASFVALSLDRGFSESQIVAKLMQLSGKAQEKGQGERYIKRTIQKVRRDCAEWLSRSKK